MRSLVFIALLVGLAGCPSNGGCPVDTISSASQCIPIVDMAIPDLRHGPIDIEPLPVD
jgi:hypothetical protein